MRGNLDPDNFISLLRKLQSLRHFPGDPGQFFGAYLDALQAAAGAKAGILCLRDASREWRTLAYSPKTGGEEKYLKVFLGAIDACEKECKARGAAIIPAQEYTVIAAPVFLEAPENSILFLGYLPGSPECDPARAVQACITLSDLYAEYKIRRGVNDSAAIKKDLSAIFEILQTVNDSAKFQAAAMSLTGELANRNSCERVSLGWVKKNYVKVVAVSHTDTFEKKMTVVRDLENAMEEAYEQDSAMSCPLPADSRLIGRSHEFYRKVHNTGYLLSVPLRSKNDIIGILTFERTQAPFSENEANRLQLTADQVSTHLRILYEKSRWFGARIGSTLRGALAKFLGCEYTWIKLLCLTLGAFLLFAALVPIPYRVDSAAMLLTDKVQYVTAPFDGYIDSVSAKPGDILRKGQEILRLDQKQYLLEEADYMAEEQNYEREIQKAQAAEELADMRIFGAKLEQTEAKLKTTRFKIEQSVIRSPVDGGVVIEGDLQKKSGAPVSLGSELFQIALIRDIYVNVDVNEMELENVHVGSEGVVAVKSRPDHEFRFRVTRINPSAKAKAEENVFEIRGEFVRAVPDWFRPGMTGVAKIESGRHTLWWILTHKLIDTLRLKLWW
ncbi:MAG: efflux RND transporter periplasmic adaptor subunit [Fibrobacteraceae bacterium]